MKTVKVVLKFQFEADADDQDDLKAALQDRLEYMIEADELMDNVKLTVTDSEDEDEELEFDEED